MLRAFALPRAPAIIVLSMIRRVLDARVPRRSGCERCAAPRDGGATRRAAVPCTRAPRPQRRPLARRRHVTRRGAGRADVARAEILELMADGANIGSWRGPGISRTHGEVITSAASRQARARSRTERWPGVAPGTRRPCSTLAPSRYARSPSPRNTRRRRDRPAGHQNVSAGVISQSRPPRLPAGRSRRSARGNRGDRARADDGCTRSTIRAYGRARRSSRKPPRRRRRPAWRSRGQHDRPGKGRERDERRDHERLASAPVGERTTGR